MENKLKCDICHYDSEELFCSTCKRRYHITEEKKCKNCRFFKDRKCIIITKDEDVKEINENYYCIYFINRNSKRS